MNRRAFLLNIGQALLLMRSDALAMRESGNDELITLFLCGDVMTGRGIDQALPHPSDPILYEPHIKNAIAYVRLAERTNGPIPTPLAFSYIWEEALADGAEAQVSTYAGWCSHPGDRVLLRYA